MILRVVTTLPVLQTRQQAYQARMILRRRSNRYGTVTHAHTHVKTHTHTHTSSIVIWVYQCLEPSHGVRVISTLLQVLPVDPIAGVLPGSSAYDVTAELYFVSISYFGILILHVGCAKLNVFCSTFTRCNVCAVCLCFRSVSLQFCNGVCRMLHVGAKVHRAFK